MATNILIILGMGLLVVGGTIALEIYLIRKQSKDMQNRMKAELERKREP